MAIPVRIAFALTLILLLMPTPARSAGGSALPKPDPSPGEKARRSDAAQAVEAYNQGLALLKAGAKLDKRAGEAPDGAERAKLDKDARERFEKAVAKLTDAVTRNPEFHQAHGSLGYALRRTGNYPASIAAYDRALALAPEYAEAIEYRGEAFLALDRTADAQQAYMTLLRLDRPKADQLMAAMKGWLERRRQDPGSLSGTEIDAFGSWLDEREELARQTSTVSRQQTPW